MTTSTVYVSIGNSDDKLTQEEWANYWATVDENIVDYSTRVYGVWQSNPNSVYQNACWAFEIHEDNREELVDSLNAIRLKFRQEQIAWANAETFFISNENADVG